MNIKDTLTSWQMSILFLAFVTGSSLYNTPSPLIAAAKNGAWMSVLCSQIAGGLLLLLLLYFHKQHEGTSFFEASRKTVGKMLNVVLQISFLFTMILMIGDLIVDIVGIFTSTLMKETPAYVFHILIVLLAAMTARAGIEVMARMFTILFIGTIIIVFSVLVLAIPYYHPSYLLPFFPEGIKPVLHGMYNSWGFPYAELFLISYLLPFVRHDQKKYVKKSLFSSYLLHSILLQITVISVIIAAGPLAGSLKYSIFQLARWIHVGNILERVEVSIGIGLIIGAFMKVTIILFTINLVISQLLKQSDINLLIFPTALICILLSQTLYANEQEFFFAVFVIWPLCDSLFGVLPIILLTFLTFLRKRRRI
jgi:spore germination protein KB